MNRRGFIGTLTALVGVVLAKIKAPVAPRKLLTEDAYLVGHRKISGDLLYFTHKYIYVQGPDGLYKWQPTKTQRHLLGFSPIDNPTE